MSAAAPRTANQFVARDRSAAEELLIFRAGLQSIQKVAKGRFRAVQCSGQESTSNARTNQREKRLSAVEVFERGPPTLKFADGSRDVGQEEFLSVGVIALCSSLVLDCTPKPVISQLSPLFSTKVAECQAYDQIRPEEVLLRDVY